MCYCSLNIQNKIKTYIFDRNSEKHGLYKSTDRKTNAQMKLQNTSATKISIMFDRAYP